MDTVYCDKCGARGEISLGQVAPEGWFYAEIKIEGEKLPSDVLYLVACSEKCCNLEWKPVPGNLRDPDPERFPGRDKTIRSRLQRIQLDDEE
jgi:hypothetical protein